MNKHTEGKWETEPGYYGQGARANVIRGNGKNIAHMDVIMWPSKTDLNVAEMEANARLIAAAPELLEALKESLQWFSKLAADHDGDYIAGNVMRHHAAVSAIIAKAEGR